MMSPRPSGPDPELTGLAEARREVAGSRFWICRSGGERMESGVGVESAEAPAGAGLWHLALTAKSGLLDLDVFSWTPSSSF